MKLNKFHRSVKNVKLRVKFNNQAVISLHGSLFVGNRGSVCQQKFEMRGWRKLGVSPSVAIRGYSDHLIPAVRGRSELCRNEMHPGQQKGKITGRIKGDFDGPREFSARGSDPTNDLLINTVLSWHNTGRQSSTVHPIYVPGLDPNKVFDAASD